MLHIPFAEPGEFTKVDEEYEKTKKPEAAADSTADANSGSNDQKQTTRSILVNCTELGYLLALQLMERGKPEEALRAFRNVLYLSPELVMGHFSMASIISW